jgi:hypothetical protein
LIPILKIKYTSSGRTKVSNEFKYFLGSKYSFNFCVNNEVYSDGISILAVSPGVITQLSSSTKIVELSHLFGRTDR